MDMPLLFEEDIQLKIPTMTSRPGPLIGLAEIDCRSCSELSPAERANIEDMEKSAQYTPIPLFFRLRVV